MVKLKHRHADYVKTEEYKMNMPFLVREKTVNKVIEIEIDKIRPNPYQPRKSFGDDMEGLAESIKQNGLLQPLTVRKDSDGYVLIAGVRRLSAV